MEDAIDTDRVVGGGRRGLYLAVLLKSADPARLVGFRTNPVAWLAPLLPERLQPAHAGGRQAVGTIISRVVEEVSRGRDRPDGLTKMGIDEVSWRRGQRYLTVVIDRVSVRLVWAPKAVAGIPWSASSMPSGNRASPDHPHQQRRRGVDHHPGRAALPKYHHLPGSFAPPLPWTRSAVRSGTAFAGRA